MRSGAARATVGTGRNLYLLRRLRHGGGIFHDLYCVWGGTDKIVPVDVYIRAAANACGDAVWLCDGAWPARRKSRPRRVSWTISPQDPASGYGAAAAR